MSTDVPRRKLSKSACASYMQCPAGYDYSYNQKIKPIKTGSPLVFGNGIDAGLNCILLGKGDPLAEYDSVFENFELGEMVPMLTDWDDELFSTSELENLTIAARVFGYKGDDLSGTVKTLLQRIKDDEPLSENQHKVVDSACRSSLYKKAELMFEAYQEDVLPFIVKTYNVQKPSGPGYLDATVEWRDIGKVVLDHKTSGKAYPPDQCDYSLELALYAAEEQVNNVAYVVLMKNIRKNRIKECSVCGHIGKGSHTTCDAMISGKRCGGAWNITISPEAEIQIVHGEVSQRAIEVAQEAQREIQRAVDAKIFPCNFPQCNSSFGKQCVFKNLKWKNDMTGLHKVERKK